MSAAAARARAPCHLATSHSRQHTPPAARSRSPVATLPPHAHPPTPRAAYYYYYYYYYNYGYSSFSGNTYSDLTYFYETQNVYLYEYNFYLSLSDVHLDFWDEEGEHYRGIHFHDGV